jgi:hypothetical protein
MVVSLAAVAMVVIPAAKSQTAVARAQGQPAEFAVYPVPTGFQMFEPEGLRQSCVNHGLPEDCGGEPSIGVDLFTNNAMLQMMLTTARLSWDDAQQPPAATWTSVSYTGFPSTSDPVLTTDRSTGRTFDVQLCPYGRPCAVNPTDRVIGVVSTDNDGASWNEPSRILSPFADKPVIGSGAYQAPAPAHFYRSAVYVCAADDEHFQSAGNAYCYRSDDGGRTWGPRRLASGGNGPCLPFAGEVEVDEDGIVYLPLEHCGGFQGLAISRDNGETWQVSAVPGVHDGDQAFDQYPDIAWDASARVYLAASSRGRPLMVTSDDHGRHWSSPVDVGIAAGIEYAEFPTVVAGDEGRAAFAFLGTTTPGFPENSNYAGVWHLYVAVTVDGGETWKTTDVTGDDPVQRGCMGAKLIGSCKRRNLLDFMDSAVDAEGRVLVAYPDGCVSATCVGPNGTPDDSTDSSYGVARQVAGPRMFAALDPP